MCVRVSQGKTAIDFCQNKQTANMILRAGPVEKRLRARELEKEFRANKEHVEANVTEVVRNRDMAIRPAALIDW